MKVALTGGIACGKSLLSRYLNELGVETIDADDIVHELSPDPAERRRIAAEVFADPVKRRELEARLHPLVKARIDAAFLRQSEAAFERQGEVAFDRQAAQAEILKSEILKSEILKTPPKKILIAIIPLLFETHWDAEYDIICTVISSPEKQVERMMTTRGYSRAEAEARLAAQLPVSEKAARSHYVIRNDATPEMLRQEAEKFVAWLQEKQQQSS